MNCNNFPCYSSHVRQPSARKALPEWIRTGMSAEEALSWRSALADQWTVTFPSLLSVNDQLNMVTEIRKFHTGTVGKRDSLESSEKSAVDPGSVG